MRSPKFLTALFTKESSPTLLCINQKPYKVLKRLHQTQNGTLFLCQDEFSCPFVLKRQNNRFDEEDDQLFREEYQILSSLSHPNIVKAADYGFDESTGSYFIVMEYIQGKPLWEAIQESPEHEIFHYFFQSLQTCQYLHHHGIIHCDLKPDNILIAEDRTLKVSDFGVWSRSGEKIKGLSPAFIAPEHMADGEETKANPATDLFALGVSFYWILTGVHPYYPNHEPMLFQEAYFQKTPKQPTTLNPTINPKWNDWLMRLIDPNPRQRSNTASIILNECHIETPGGDRLPDLIETPSQKRG
ncbi:MAG: serine/threonine protein kinase [Nitrospirota bacterium]|nr:serine/threonine protein kinase [Nitrospirota bacterium]MDH5585443.1 serine/threonine protein kinase [Nitrospirota bacterium]